MIALALYQPDIPQNTGTILRLCACFDAPVHLIHPAGFQLGDRAMKRSGMDYLDHVRLTEHADWEAFARWCDDNQRVILAMTTKGDSSLYDHTFAERDVILLGRESAGLPSQVMTLCQKRLRIPIRSETRSLNVAVAAAIATGEAHRQLAHTPSPPPRTVSEPAQ